MILTLKNRLLSIGLRTSTKYPLQTPTTTAEGKHPALLSLKTSAELLAQYLSLICQSPASLETRPLVPTLKQTALVSPPPSSRNPRAGVDPQIESVIIHSTP